MSQPTPTRPLYLPLLQLPDEHDAVYTSLPEEKSATRSESVRAVSNSAAAGPGPLTVPAELRTLLNANNTQLAGCAPKVIGNVAAIYDQDIADTHQSVDLYGAKTYDWVGMKTPGNTAVSSPAQIAMCTFNNTAVPLFDLAAMHQIAEMATGGVADRTRLAWDGMTAEPPEKQQ
ncbi:hypothetical protein CFE70_001352 [Pyrenophora teres f. teres 0-1]|uniref:Uncharacterized protein n=1 Tax=Pyrenophora teres f. teres (strain 0-1) TaxID=861557 RepID=E3RG21_PYRTT|nr:hypothetical protein PTT_06713 [Pyrenophora teres f. teres 0-1]KAE8832658.1 hypothetical protein HRS9122_08371 [Pyrenophora teres f. teres]KAE8852610.1 hypothetical protein PTNB29_10000 [Pyrenophora teres f. teres]KAE8854884.1 hypothetical protein PTNB73_10314 [Pyrenophora teres f. teres]KAK1918626.1 hypothetical protein P3342_001675 [Pyrenophora teres f. teres]